ncbi:uncharacterized protein IUM83_07628 [Phytophthora cinnamomi]|uniref:uncharacterized protein n=1 Tax=Phytophthora cinnamomi TaxID=4785 RepID=UPI00355AAF6B|nr:hypothetical protein IUM83_07628 [Phytophthora cinnamomi]
MESRSAQDGGAVRRSGAFSGRQVPLEMGTLRVGGSGRPVPAVFSSGAARRSVTASLEAPAASATALSPRLTVEPHPRSPFRRREELSKTVVRSRDDSSRSRFQVKKKRKKKPKEQPRLQGVREGDEEDAVVSDEISKPPVEQQTNKRRPLASTPRVSKREKRIATALPSGNDAAIRAKEERRAIAREYMQLQKTSRRIWNAKAKEQYQREQEKRQQQLEILEATRLQKLRLSKKRADGHKNQELVDPIHFQNVKSTQKLADVTRK